MKNQNTSVPLVRYLSYAAPHITTTWLVAPIGIIQGIYAKHYGLSLTTIATIVLLARLFDAILDPTIGYYSDRYHRRMGTRKPFILVGGVSFIVCSYFLYVPPLQVSALYFAGWFILFYLAWTLFEIPHLTWASELGDTAEAKNKIFSIRNMTYYSGLLLFYAIPLLPIFETGEITPETLKVSVIVASLLMLPLLYLCLKYTPDSPRTLSTNQQKLEVKPPNNIVKEWRLFLKAGLANKPFLIFVAALSFKSLATGMWYGLIFTYVDAYLGLGHQFAQMFLIAFAVGVVVTPVWYKLANRIGKKNTWLFAMVLIMISFIYTSALTPGNTYFGELLALKIVQTMGFTCMWVVAPSMLSEIVDYDTLKFGTERTGLYFSFYTFIQKAIGALALALGFGLAGWYGFDATVTTHSEESVWGLILAMTWVPLFFACLALVFIALSPINVRRHSIIRRRLDTRATRVATQAALQRAPQADVSSESLTPRPAIP
ncbi:MFS transporter [Porticoccaceae bacterium]|nr:MFS transporter [Porticoccaceae bacterium]